MIKIPVVETQTTEIDPVTGLETPRIMSSPETPFPQTMVAVTCDGRFYTVYEQGDAVP